MSGGKIKCEMGAEEETEEVKGKMRGLISSQGRRKKIWVRRRGKERGGAEVSCTSSMCIDLKSLLELKCLFKTSSTDLSSHRL